jgi:hypothetical protein
LLERRRLRQVQTDEEIAAIEIERDAVPPASDCCFEFPYVADQRGTRQLHRLESI